MRSGGWHLEWNLNAPGNLKGLSIVQALQLGKDLLVSLHKISKLVDQPRTLKAGDILPPSLAEGFPCGCNSNVDILLRGWTM
jgi:hypothetical protein